MSRHRHLYYRNERLEQHRRRLLTKYEQKNWNVFFFVEGSNGIEREWSRPNSGICEGICEFQEKPRFARFKKYVKRAARRTTRRNSLETNRRVNKLQYDVPWELW